MPSPNTEERREALDSSTDPRALRTRRRLRGGLLALAGDDPSRLTVSAICEATKTDRATFYRHYPSLELLAADTITDLVTTSADEWDRTGVGVAGSRDVALQVLTRFLEQVAQNWALHRWAVGIDGSAAAVRVLLDRFIESVVHQREALHHDTHSVWDRLAAGYFGGAPFGVLMTWLEFERPPVEPALLAHWLLDAAWQMPNMPPPPLGAAATREEVPT